MGDLPQSLRFVDQKVLYQKFACVKYLMLLMIMARLSSFVSGIYLCRDFIDCTMKGLEGDELPDRVQHRHMAFAVD
jgi:hypothetical protein